MAAELTPLKRQALGAVTAAVVLGYGARHQFGTVWGVTVGVCAVLIVFGVGVLGDRLGRRRTSRCLTPKVSDSFFEVTSERD